MLTLTGRPPLWDNLPKQICNKNFLFPIVYFSTFFALRKQENVNVFLAFLLTSQKSWWKIFMCICTTYSQEVTSGCKIGFGQNICQKPKIWVKSLVTSFVCTQTCMYSFHSICKIYFHILCCKRGQTFLKCANIVVVCNMCIFKVWFHS